jgi:hydroxymethylbilane synthase
MSSLRTLRLGTRASQLARWQSDWTAAQLEALGARVEIVEIATRGDVAQQGSVASLGIQGVFTKEIQTALLAGEVDLAVHSMKDLPTEQVPGLTLAATPPREDVADALVARDGMGTLAELPPRARIGTGSLRRRAQLLHLRPDLQILGIRGNVDTRLRKLDAGEYDAIVLAVAGLTRLGLGGRIVDRLAPPRMLPAPGQGALAIECRADDAEAIGVVAQLEEYGCRLATTAERVVLAALHGGCSAPVAAWGRIDGEQLMLDALVADAGGREVLRASSQGAIAGGEGMATAERLGRIVAENLLAQGAARLIDEARLPTGERGA